MEHNVSKKKVLFIMESFKGGGAEKVLIDLLNKFDYNQYTVTLLILNACGPHLNSIPKEIEVLALYRKAPNWINKVLLHFRRIRNIVWRRRILSVIGNRKFGSIISFMEGPAVKLHSFIFNHSKRNITWIHSNISVNHWTKWLYKNLDDEKSVYTRMDSIVFVSKGAKNAFAEKFGIDKNMHVIYNVIDRNNIIAKSTEFNVPKHKFTIVNVGRLVEQKRQDRLIEVANILKQRGNDFELWILGVGPLETDLKELAEKLHVSDSVKFFGFQSNPYPYIKSADIFLLTSDTEGYPTVVCESLCLGKPVISTDITGSDELLGGEVGILTGFDPTEIADAVENVMKNPELQKKYAVASENKGLEFNPKDIVSKIERLLA